MKVILTEKVPTLGNVGEIVNISAGYARNFVIPNKLGVIADAGNAKALANQQKALAKKVAEQKADAQAVKSKIDGLTLEFVKKAGANGKLFGAITTLDLSNELKSKGVEIERRLITVNNAMKNLGKFTAKVKLFQGVEAEFKINIVMDPAQAEELKAKQIAAEKRKEEKAAAAALAAENGEEPAKEDAAVEQTEDQRLAAQANAILRS
ncbi:MAG: 50S ribosomal protein L9 [Bdellovibrionales bacterium CG12_big_fil_rev_8_21_14_0_65_38_15]|nr:MAG: 50S ribosomal protein L9 [Bdellovibrionales bacterium CG22_combo_CG10-13_8_21_14_all_38_13]PIQ56073.1 MAG: 50S ribosomal protein L9 [Bdellovibrionales bacterium CG12_big_fil_rev_8_21_14_0_65_38_15]